MKYTPEVAAALTAANLARGVAWQPTPPPLCGCPIRHYTPRMRLDLELSGNAFAVLRTPRAHDVFAFLWRLHPRYAPLLRPAMLRPPTGRVGRWLARRLPATMDLLRRSLAFGSIRTGRAHRDLTRLVCTLEPFRTIADITAYRQSVFKDRNALAKSEVDDDDKVRLLPKPSAHWCDDLIAFFCSEFSGWSGDRVMDSPLVQLYQVRRAWAIAHGVDVVDEAHELAVDFARRSLAAHGDLIRARAAVANN